MRTGDSHYLVGSGIAMDVTDPRNPVIINDRLPGGEIGFNLPLRKWILIRSHTCCGAEPPWVRPCGSRVRSFRN